MVVIDMREAFEKLSTAKLRTLQNGKAIGAVAANKVKEKRARCLVFDVLRKRREARRAS